MIALWIRRLIIYMVGRYIMRRLQRWWSEPPRHHIKPGQFPRY